MRNISILFVAMLALNGQINVVWAAEDDYKYCRLAGYFLGFDEKVLFGVSLSLATREGHSVVGGVCKAVWQQGFEVAKKGKLGETFTNDELEIVQEGVEFSNRVYRFIGEGAGF